MEKRGLPGLHVAKYSRANHRSLLASLSKEFGLRQPTLAFVNARLWAGQYQRCHELDWARISLSTNYKSGTSPITLIHEFAHHVVDSWDENCDLYPHGPEFVGVYGDCLAMAGLVPYEGWRALCQRFKVDFLDTRLAGNVKTLRGLVKKRAAEAAQMAHPHKRPLRINSPRSA
jgi:hypothetical protein